MPHQSSWERLRSRWHAGVAKRTRRSSIYVLAGTNGAGKSSLLGAMLLKKDVQPFNPDEAARRLVAVNPGITQEQANSAAWLEGKRLLERAIVERLDFAFETTLGGQTIKTLLEQAAASGIEVRIWNVGLTNVALHIARVRSRVARGGHDIPEAKIRERYDRSRLNLIESLPKLTELLVYDNSEERDPESGAAPRPKLLLQMKAGKITRSCALDEAPGWVKPILAAALKLSGVG
jgi:predicted ABC-type ATPase